MNFIQGSAIVGVSYKRRWLAGLEFCGCSGWIHHHGHVCAHNNLKQNKYNNMQLYLALVDNIIIHYYHYYTKFYFENHMAFQVLPVWFKHILLTIGRNKLLFKPSRRYSWFHTKDRQRNDIFIDSNYQYTQYFIFPHWHCKMNIVQVFA